MHSLIRRSLLPLALSSIVATPLFAEIGRAHV